MRHSFTAVLEQGNAFSADFATEPFEAGWASEARWFIRLLESGNDTRIEATPEVSPDGLLWCPDGTAPLKLDGTASEPRMATALQTGFGNWLRLNVKLGGESPRAKVLIYVALKE